MKYGLAIFPSKKLQDMANSLRKRYDTKYALIPPHLTLKEAFELKETELAAFILQLRDIGNQITPFTINVYKYSSFHPVSNTIFMKVRENEGLMELQRKLNSSPLPNNSDYPFIPHITVGQHLKDDEFHDIIGRMRMEAINHEEICDRFQLLYQLENGSWTVYETFLLGGNQS